MSSHIIAPAACSAEAREQHYRAAGAALALGYRTMLGLDGTTVAAAADAAWTPTGPSKERLRELIAARRAQLRVPAVGAGVAA